MKPKNSGEQIKEYLRLIRVEAALIRTRGHADCYFSSTAIAHFVYETELLLRG